MRFNRPSLSPHMLKAVRACPDILKPFQISKPLKFPNGFNMLKQLHVLHLTSRFRHLQEWTKIKFGKNITGSPGNSFMFPLLTDMNVLTQ